MKKILIIESSINGPKSFSNKLSNAILEKLKKAYPEHSIKTVDLAKHPLPHLEQEHWESFFIPKEQHEERHAKAIAHSDTALRDLMEADILVIGVPIYNFSIPSSLKSWLDHITRKGITFNYSEKGPEGLVKGKKVYLAMAGNGVYTEGPMKPMDHASTYLSFMLSFLGMNDITTFWIEGLAIPGIKDTAEAKAYQLVDEAIV